MWLAVGALLFIEKRAVEREIETVECGLRGDLILLNEIEALEEVVFDMYQEFCGYPELPKKKRFFGLLG